MKDDKKVQRKDNWMICLKNEQLLRLFRRFTKKYKLNSNGCWIWQGQKTNGGYGLLTIKSKNTLAHRISYSIYKGELLNGFVIHHVCNNPICVNPNHLEQVTQEHNVYVSKTISAINRNKTHCVHGHKFSSENIYTYILNGRERRSCRKCARLRARKKLGAINPNRNKRGYKND